MEKTSISDDSSVLWRYIPLGKHSSPSAPVRSTINDQASTVWKNIKNTPRVRGSIVGPVSSLWSRILGKDSDQGSAVESLENPSRDILDQVAGEPDWNDAALALGSMVETWLERDGAGPFPWLRIVVGAPFSGTHKTIVRLAETQKWPIIQPPSPPRILEGGTEWLSKAAKTEGSLLVIPQLEHCYLRHFNGLKLIRKLLDWLMSNERPCLIGCDSWAWAYLKRSLSLGSLLPVPYTLEAFQETELRHWFRQLCGDSRKNPFVFRRADDGSVVLPLDDRSASCSGKKDCDNEDSNNFLQRLAVYSRGIPEVARAFWRRGLRTASKEAMEEKARKWGFDNREKTVWVLPWNEMDFPRMPTEADRSQLFVLHALLFHESLNPHLLRQLLSLSTMDVLETLHHLRRAELVEADAEERVWRISPYGYPAVRGALKTAGYLVDDL